MGQWKLNFSDSPDSLNSTINGDGGIGWPYMGTDFACRENFDLARKWLSDCVSKCPHENCTPLKDINLPTRVVDLGSPGSSAQPKLLLTRGQLGQYVALSHCWGGDIPCKTMTALVDDYLQG